jgi:hypothetical protein
MNYQPSDQWHVCGNSITQQGWATQAGGLSDQINAQRWAMAAPSWRVPNFSPGRGAAGPAFPTWPALTSFGVAGWQISDLKANQATAIQAFKPKQLIIEIDVNDFAGSTPLPQFTADYANVMDTTKLLFPDVKITCLGMLCRVEQWTNVGPAYLSSPAGLSTNPYDIAIQSLCAARVGWTQYADQKGWSLALNVAGNTPMPGVAAFLTVDGIHPTNPTKVIMGTQLLTHFTLVP